MVEPQLDFRFSSTDRSMTSVQVTLDEEKITVGKKFISALKLKALISDESLYYRDSEYLTEIFSIIAIAIQLKKENVHGRSYTVKKYDFGNEEDFVNDFVDNLSKALVIYPIEAVFSFFQECKLDDLYNFVNDLSKIDFE